MGYITQQEIAEISPVSGTAKAISNLDELKFAKIEGIVNDIIFKKTGVAIPDDAEDSPIGLKAPAAWLIEYYYFSMSDNLSEEKSKQLNTNYNNAIELLNNYTNEVNSLKIQSVAIEGLYEL